MPDVPPAPPTLRTAALTGVRWTAAARILAELAGLAALIVTARLLDPADVGHAAVGLVVVAIAVGLAQQGFGSAIVRKPKLATADASTVQILSLGFGLAIGAAVYLVAPVAEPIGAGVVSLLRFAALAFPLTAIGAVPMAMLQRSLDFRRLAIIDAFSSLAGAATTVVMAAAGAGATSMIAGPLVLTTLTSAGCLLYSPRLGTAFSPAAARELGGFGLPTAAAGLLYIAARNIDYAILAGRISAVQVGYYFRAYQLGGEYQSKVSGILLRMALPLFSRASELEELRKIRSRMSRVHTATLFPFLIFLMALAPEIIPFLFGHVWDGAIRPTQILAVAGLVAVIGTGAGPLLTAAGYPQSLLLYTFVAVAIYGTTVWFLAPLGIIAVSIGVVVNKIGSLYVLQRYYIQRLVGIPVSDVIKHDIIPALGACIPLALTALAGRAALAALGFGPGLIVIALAPLCGLAYMWALHRYFPETWHDLVSLARRSDRVDASKEGELAT